MRINIDIDIFIDLYNQHLSDAKIARILQVGATTIKRLRDFMQLPANHAYRLSLDYNIFITYYNHGLTDNEISRVLDIDRAFVRKYRISLGLERNKYLCSDEHRKHLSKINTGKKLSEEVKRKIGDAQIGRKHSDETKRKMSSSQIGDKNHAWRNGRTELKTLIRSNAKYIEWRNNCFIRDNYKCTWCGSKSNLQVDHINPLVVIIQLNNIKTIYEALTSDELWDLSNGRVLCESCHKKTDTYSWKALKILRNKLSE